MSLEVSMVKTTLAAAKGTRSYAPAWFIQYQASSLIRYIVMQWDNDRASCTVI